MRKSTGHENATGRYAIVSMGGVTGELPFSYTVGMTDYGLPELLVFGLPAEPAGQLLDSIVRRLRGGFALTDGALMGDASSMPLALKVLELERAYGYVSRFRAWYEAHLGGPRFMQVVLPDRAGRFPWQAGYQEAMRQMQPELWPHLH